MHIQHSDIKEFSRFYRANLINCLTGAKPAVLIGSANKEGKTNLALFSNIIHIGADPAMLGYLQRPIGESGDTFRNIMETGCYTFNLVTPEIVEQAHFTSAKFSTSVSEFEACKLTPEFVPGFTAPFVTECRVKIGLTCVEVIPVKLNNTTLVIGSIDHILLPDSILKNDGNIIPEAAGLVSAVGLEQYCSLSTICTMSYAKPDNLPQF